MHISNIYLISTLLLSVIVLSPSWAQDDQQPQQPALNQTSTEPAVNPFCKICTCEDDVEGPKITCNKDISAYLFDTYYWLNKNTNSSYQVEELTVQNSPMLTLDLQFPASNLTLLNLANNSIVNVSDNVFRNLQNMEVLILSDNNIELLHPDAFNGLYLEGDFTPLKSLRILKLDHNRIHSLDDNIFEHTSRIEVLSLSHNPFKIIDQQTVIAITSLVYLKDLDLSYTQIASLPDNFMHTPKYISTLDLSGNLFEAIPQTLGQSHNLEVLFMNRNPIKHLNATNGFPKIPTLKVLHLCNMDELSNVSIHSLSALVNLEELHMADNIKLSYLDKMALSDRQDDAEYATWPPLKKLYLQNNKLTRIDMPLVLRWDGLSELDLTNNPWTCECENQWMVEELIPVYLKIDEAKARSLRCAAPIEMVQYTFYDVYEKHSTMRCLDVYGNRPEKDGAMLVGILAGVLIAIPLVLFVIYSYQRHWFGLCDKSPAAYSRQFYKRTGSTDEYF